MNKEQIINKITKKKEYSGLPYKDVLMVYEKFDNDKYSDEEKFKLTRELLRNIYSGFGGRKLLLTAKKGKINFEKFDPEGLLKKHLSTRERFPYYKGIYERILKSFDRKKEISIVDLGAGINGLSYRYFKELGFNASYLAIEGINQLVELTNQYFKKEKIKGKAIHESLLNLNIIKKIIKKSESPRLIFLFKVVDSLEKLERDYTKKFLSEIAEVIDRDDKIILSFATESWQKRRKFYVTRNWLIEFINEKFEVTDDFKFGGERYIIFKRK